jgi:hypothetical protein
MNNNDNYNNTENTWDDRRPKMNRWWEMAENEDDAVSNVMYTSLIAQQATRQWLGYHTPSKRIVESKRNTRPTYQSPKNCLVGGETRVYIIIDNSDQHRNYAHMGHTVFVATCVGVVNGLLNVVSIS